MINAAGVAGLEPASGLLEDYMGEGTDAGGTRQRGSEIVT